jgi:hypothetical protein
MAGTYESITTQTLGSNQTTVSFTSIPQTYTDLVIVAEGESTSGGSILMRFNSDTGSNYNTAYMYGTGSGSGTAGSTGQTGAGIFMMRTTTNLKGGGITHLNGYSNTTTYKTGISRNFGYDPIIWFASGVWLSTAAITRIDFADESGGQFKTGFTFSLYGIKAA